MKSRFPFTNRLRQVLILNIRVQIWIAFLGLLAIYLAALSISNRHIAAGDQVARDHVDSISAALGMLNAVDTIADVVGESPEDAIHSPSARIDAATTAFDQAMALQVSRMTIPGEEALTQEIQSALGRIRESAVAARDAGDPHRSAIIRGRLLPEIRKIRPMITRLSQMNSEAIKSKHGATLRETRIAKAILHITLGIGLAATIVFVFSIGRRIVNPLLAMTEAADAIRMGHLDQTLPVKSRDELGQLANAFNQMTLEIKRLRALDADSLQRAYQTTQTAIDSLPDGVVMIGEHRNVELANETARRLFGLAAGQDNLQERLPVLDAALGRVGDQPDGYRSSIDVSDGGMTRSFLPRSVALKGGGGRTIGWTLILVDVTSFRRLDQLKDSLLSMASHELKTPLTSMRMILPLLLEQSIGPLNPKQMELITVALGATERMQRIVDTILDLGRLASGKVPLQARPMRPCDLATTSVETRMSAYATKGVELRLEIPKGLASVQCDPGQIEHVFSNILSNALRHTPAGGSVLVSAQMHGDAVKLEVRDTGRGIAATHLLRLFETFYRVPGQRSDTGSGLGLALVKQIIEWHGGAVGVESVVDKGSTFWFTLPIARTGGKEDNNDNGNGNGRMSPATDDSIAATG